MTLKNASTDGNDDGDEHRQMGMAYAAELIGQYRAALEQCVRVCRDWHAMPGKPGALDCFDIYFNHSPEMKLIRDVLGKMPEQK